MRRTCGATPTHSVCGPAVSVITWLYIERGWCVTLAQLCAADPSGHEGSNPRCTAVSERCRLWRDRIGCGGRLQCTRL